VNLLKKVMSRTIRKRMKQVVFVIYIDSISGYKKTECKESEHLNVKDWKT